MWQPKYKSTQRKCFKHVEITKIPNMSSKSFYWFRISIILNIIIIIFLNKCANQKHKSNLTMGNALHITTVYCLLTFVFNHCFYLFFFINFRQT